MTGDRVDWLRNPGSRERDHAIKKSREMIPVCEEADGLVDIRHVEQAESARRSLEKLK
ncbi:hypothetical protein ACO2I3_20645 [Leptospira interrogans]